MHRRDFLKGVAVGATALSGSSPLLAADPPKRSYQGPNVIIIRFGGGVRRQETIASDETYAPFLKKVLAPQGVLFPKLEIASNPKVETSHGQGTLYILTGKYEKYEDVEHRLFGDRFEAKVPTLFEAFRKSYDIPAHQALMVNGEDRKDEEFFTFSNHLGFGINYRSTVVSLYRYKLYIARLNALAAAQKGAVDPALLKTLADMEDLDYRNPFRTVTRPPDSHGSKSLAFHPELVGRDPASTPELERFWAKWAGFYGKTGLVNPRGDRLLAELSVWAMRWLQPRLMMVNFQDPDYVHWGNKNFYTRGVAIVDEGLRRIYEAAQADEFYRDRTVFLVVPDCGRDTNPFMACPYQHHFGSRTSHEIFLLAVGPGIDRARIVDKRAEQNEVAATVGGIMKFGMPAAEGPARTEVFA